MLIVSVSDLGSGDPDGSVCEQSLTGPCRMSALFRLLHFNMVKKTKKTKKRTIQGLLYKALLDSLLLERESLTIPVYCNH